ncbi:MAG: FG-GAP-like repeat-containing protein [Candidatus Helarchaeota archaeon]
MHKIEKGSRILIILLILLLLQGFSFLQFQNYKLPVKLALLNGQLTQLNGGNVTVSENFRDLIVSDIDRDGIKEVIIVGQRNQSSIFNASINIYHFLNNTFQLESFYTWNEGYPTTLTKVITGDLDRDGALEIITIGFYNTTPVTGALWIWNLTQGNILLETKESWQNGNTIPLALAMADLDRDGSAELIIGGIISDLQAQLRIYNYSYSNLKLEKAIQWNDTKTYCTTVATMDLDRDGTLELISGGHTFLGTELGSRSQIRIWNYTDHVFYLEDNYLSNSNDSVKVADLKIADVDRDGSFEIVTIGSKASQAELSVYNYISNQISLEIEHFYTLSSVTFGKSLDIQDIDYDGVLEIISGNTGFNGTANIGFIKVYNVSKDSLILEKERIYNDSAETGCNGALGADLNQDGCFEIIVIGNVKNASQFQRGFLTMWDLEFPTYYNSGWKSQPLSAPYSLLLRNSTTWSSEGNTIFRDSCAGDLDHDGIPEIVIVGEYENAQRDRYGLITIYNFTQNQFQLESSKSYRESYNTTFTCVSIADIDNDGTLELVVAGNDQITDGTAMSDSFSVLSIWNYTSRSLVLESKKIWQYLGLFTYVNSISIADFDSNGVLDLIFSMNTVSGAGILTCWTYIAHQLSLVTQYTFSTAFSGYFMKFPLAKGDINQDGTIEIIVGDFYNNASVRYGRLQILNYTGAAFHHIYSENWTNSGETEIRSLAVDDINRDGILELISGGITRIGSNYKGPEIRVWNFSNNVLHLIAQNAWYSPRGILSFSTLTISDFDADGSLEILSISTNKPLNHVYNHLKVWNLTDNFFHEEAAYYWGSYAGDDEGTIVCDDFDLDGIVECITTVQDDSTSPIKAELRAWDSNNYGIEFPNCTITYDPIAETIQINTLIWCSYAAHNILDDTELLSTSYSIKTGEDIPTGLAGALLYNSMNGSQWSATSNVSSLSKGIYYVEITADDGHLSSSITSYFTIGFNWTNSYNLILADSIAWDDNNTRNTMVDMAVEDIDGDTIPEIITLTRLYFSGATDYIQLRVWNFTEDRLMLEAKITWDFYGSNTLFPKSLAVGDLAGNELPEIVCVSYGINATGEWEGLINVFNLTNGKIMNVTSLHYYNMSNTKIRDAQIGDVDGDLSNELITGGYYQDNGYYKAQLIVWNITNGTLTIEQAKSWGYNTINNTGIFNIALSDLTGEGILEIIAGGFIEYRSFTEWGQLTIFNSSSGVLRNLTTHIFKMESDLSLYYVDASDLDGDGLNELVLNFKVDSSSKAIIVVANFSNNVIQTESSLNVSLSAYPWIFSLTCGDIDSDNVTELAAVGLESGGSWTDSFLFLWNLTSNTLLQENFTTFSLSTFDKLCNVKIIDVDKDGIPECIASGDFDNNSISYGDLLVWRPPLLRIKLASIVQNYLDNSLDIFNVSVYSLKDSKFMDNIGYYYVKFTIFTNEGSATGISGGLEYNSNYMNWQKTNVDVSTLPDGDYYITVHFESYDSLGTSVHFTGDTSEFIVDNTPPSFIETPSDVEYLVNTRGHQVRWTPTDPHPGTYYIYIDSILDTQGSWQSGQAILYNIDGFAKGQYNITIVIQDSHLNQKSYEFTLTVTDTQGIDWNIIILIVAVIIGAIIAASLVLAKRQKVKPLSIEGKGVYEVPLEQVMKNVLFLLEGIPSLPIEKIAEKIGWPYDETEELLVKLTYRGKLKGFIDDRIYYNDADFLD